MAGITAFQPTSFQNTAFQILDPASSRPSIVLPIGMTFFNWASNLLIDFSTKEVPIPPMDDSGWKDWAMRVYARNLFSNDAIPNPQFFTDWRVWAMRVCGAING